MKSQDDLKYHRARAKQAKKLADQATDAGARAAHLEMAKAYRALAKSPATERGTLRIVAS